VSDIRDPREAERLSFEEPDAHLRRREFLQRAAVTAGLAGMGLTLDPETIVAQAAGRQRRRALPSPRNMPIDTFVVLMMENRSFDHYLGWLPNADGRQAGLNFTDKNGQQFATRRMGTDFQGCAHPDPDHSWGGGRAQLDGGKCDGFLRSGASDVFAISYYGEDDLGFTPAAAKEFTVFDRFFCSLMDSTYPNREYMHAAQSYGVRGNALPIASGGFPDTTIWAALDRAGVSNRYFFTDVPIQALWGVPGVLRSGQVEEYYLRCETGTLPSVSFVDPAFLNEGGGTSGDEHPHGDVRVGQAFQSDVVTAFMESKHWERGALFMVYDEWGGFFDHVPPPRVPDIRSSADPANDYGQMGFRIPVVVVSPWVKRKHVEHSIYGFESILKMIEYRFALKPLTRRDQFARNIARSFDFDSKPQTDRPSLPSPVHIVGGQCAGQGINLLGETGGQAERPKEHDLGALVTSGYLERLGFDYKPATPATTFRQPDTIVKAHRAAGG
jgi:phospholipase C